MSGGDVSIELWLNEYKQEALESVLNEDGTSIEEQLQEYLIELYADLVPVNVQQSIRQRIDAENAASREAAEAERRFAVFHVIEEGNSIYFLVNEHLDMLQTAVKLRSYIRRPSGNPPLRFTGLFFRGERITPERFDTYVQERMDNTGRVTGAFDIDLDKGTFSALHIMDGWQQFRIQDISTAAYYATKKSIASWDDRWKVFMERLDGKQLTEETEAQFLQGPLM